jgi:hypothetical protein
MFAKPCGERMHYGAVGSLHLSVLCWVGRWLAKGRACSPQGTPTEAQNRLGANGVGRGVMSLIPDKQLTAREV